MTRYLITGGAGFIGSHIAETLLERGEAVRIFDSLDVGKAENLTLLRQRFDDVEFIQGDIRDLDALKKATEGIEIIFHQAALASVPRSVIAPTASLEINVNGTQNVLIAARDSGVRRVVYASSSSIYGNAPQLPKQEHMRPEPISPYAAHKLAGETLCHVFTRIYGLETVSLRYFNVFGPRQDPYAEYAAVVPRFLASILTGRRPVIFGDGEQTRDFTYIENVVQANLQAAIAPRAVGEVLNIGLGESISLNTMLCIAGKLLNREIEAEYRPARPGDVRNSLADISKARELINYHPSVRFEDGLARTLASMQSPASLLAG
ncbi:SDR family oxidoreductase [Thermosporothrix hazakensis]|jgi:UDP-glucose 4-epimerase|nr:SDR family oxidoreductase [Thermosporothrix hazakensis]BBH88621.1 GDP-mannose 4,6-dehydratase [Thermosporothrix sp. COM3]GCE46806.1 GDP-mannose 4,6-dehydratase [Thermosporothrix hazakensis]